MGTFSKAEITSGFSTLILNFYPQIMKNGSSPLSSSPRAGISNFIPFKLPIESLYKHSLITVLFNQVFTLLQTMSAVMKASLSTV